jgi:drug/metabolite transporter (DMT)-like permease
MAAGDIVLAERPLVPRGMQAILGSSICFGAMAVCVHQAATEMHAGQIAFFRFAGSFAVMLVATGGRGLRARPGNLGALAFRGLVGAAAITLYFIGIAGIGAGLATLIQTTYPVFAAILAAVFLGERFTARLGTALGLNLAGVATIVLAPGIALGADGTIGALSAAGSAVLAGAAITAVRHLRRQESASLITTYFMGVAALATMPALLWGLPPPTPVLVLSLAGLILTSIAGQWLLHHGLGFTTAAQGSLAAASNVLAATLFEALLFGRPITLAMLLGATLMFSAIVLASRTR